MKTKALLFSILLFSTAAVAQPTLTAASNNPVAGDIFTVIDCDTTGVTQGASGANVTWDYHTLSTISSTQINIVTCSSTPYCDSFPGSNLSIAVIDTGVDSEYVYYTTNANLFENNGESMGSGAFLYNPKPDILLEYPVVYNTTFLDTSIDYFSPPVTDYEITYRSTQVDAYGTLILPSGTYNNVLRLHEINTVYDSTPGNGVTYEGSYEFYDWFTPNFHFLLLEMDLDSAGGPSLSVYNVDYSTTSTSSVAQRNNDEAGIELSPNPASDIINIKLDLDVVQNTSITISNISGRVVGNINTSSLKTGTDTLQYSVKNMPSGVYIVHLINAAYNISKKLVISH